MLLWPHMSSLRRVPAIPRPMRAVAHSAARVLARGCGVEDGLLLAGVSGGPDSAVLVAVLSTLSSRLGFRLHAVHVNHHLTPHAARLEELAQAACASCVLPVPLEVVHVQVPANSGHGVESSARTARHRALELVQARLGAARIALGHTATDVAETFMQRLLEGAGRGQAAMRAVEGNRVRPLCHSTRAEVRRLAVELNLPFMDDPMNEDPALLRGFLRQQVWPALQSRFGSPDKTLSRACQMAQEDHDALEELARKVWVPGEGAQRDVLAAQPLAVATRALRQMAEQVAGRPIRTGHEAVRKAALAAARPGGPSRRFKMGPVWLVLANSQVTAQFDSADQTDASARDVAACYGSAPGQVPVREADSSERAGKVG